MECREKGDAPESENWILRIRNMAHFTSAVTLVTVILNEAQ
jgi:hypothetical protein